MSDHLIIVDKNDKPIGYKHWKELQNDDIHRSSALWLTDINSNDILLAQRAWTKKNDSGMWGCAVAGSLEVGETYESNIVKEISEEIALTDLKLKVGPKMLIDHGNNKFFCQWFLASVDKNKVQIKLQQEEIEAIKWVPKMHLIKDVKQNPQNYVPSMLECLITLEVI